MSEREAAVKAMKAVMLAQAGPALEKLCEQMLDLIEGTRDATIKEVVAWLRDKESMAEYDGLSQCEYTDAVFPEALAKALEEMQSETSSRPAPTPAPHR